METACSYQSHAEKQSLSGPLMANLVRDVLARGVPFRFQAGGSSMFPFIRDGDVISLVPVPYDGPGLGDVVAFIEAKGKRLVVHRLVRSSNAGYFLKGDHYRQGELDGPVSKAHLLGIVSRVERRGRRIHLGLGPERSVIAVMSRIGVVYPLVNFAAAVFRPFKKLVTGVFFHPKQARLQ